MFYKVKQETYKTKVPRVYAYYFNHSTNLGDQVCCPVDYFEPLRCAQKIDWDSEPEQMADGPVIVGGGGLLNPAMTEKLGRLAFHAKTPVVVWGVGTNVHRETRSVYPDFLSKVQLVGLRDFGNPFEYVPCPSCLHPALDRPGSVQHEFVIYEHAHHTIGIAPSAPRMANHQPKENLEAVIEFLSSGDLVITYHGCFWALLLQRRAMIYRPFSNRFFFFKPKVVFCDGENWRAKAKEASPAPGYLEECRLLNRQFAEKVFRLLGL